MKHFKFLDHPSKLKIQAFGKNLEELFTNAAMGMMTYLYPKNVDIIDHETKAIIRLKARDEKELLIDLLSELLELSDQKDVCYNDFHFEKFNEEELTVTAWGRRVKAKQDIKKVLPDVTLKEEGIGYSALINFDI